MKREDLLGQALEIKEHPSRVLATERKGSILVAYGDSVVWSLAAEECRTWFVSQPEDSFCAILITSALTFINLSKSSVSLYTILQTFTNLLLNFTRLTPSLGLFIQIPSILA
jgi:hypothetical protein